MSKSLYWVEMTAKVAVVAHSQTGAEAFAQQIIADAEITVEATRSGYCEPQWLPAIPFGDDDEKTCQQWLETFTVKMVSGQLETTVKTQKDFQDLIDQGWLPNKVEFDNGQSFTAKARGAFPYYCALQEEYPDAMIYYSQSGSWCCEHDQVFKTAIAQLKDRLIA